MHGVGLETPDYPREGREAGCELLLRATRKGSRPSCAIVRTLFELECLRWNGCGEQQERENTDQRDKPGANNGTYRFPQYT